ncbi:MAG: hypothetical protein GX568_04255 [Candidatus Gastranaerophilales bacterium]|nr:hypothetical protein [Candidatus Gastranaerophilales bacterium]
MLNVSAIAPNNSAYKRQAFSSVKLADVHVKKVDKNGKETLIPAHFTRLDPKNSPEDEKAIKFIIKKWDKNNISQMAHETAKASLIDELYGIELTDKKAPLEKRLVTFANMDKYNYINGLVVNPKYRYTPRGKREIQDCGKVMMAMLAKRAQTRDIETFSLRLWPIEDTEVKTFYYRIGMEEYPKYKQFFYFKPDKMNAFIDNMNRDYKLGEINEPA